MKYLGNVLTSLRIKNDICIKEAQQAKSVP